jgi:hypothetical protein
MAAPAWRSEGQRRAEEEIAGQLERLAAAFRAGEIEQWTVGRGTEGDWDAPIVTLRYQRQLVVIEDTRG